MENIDYLVTREQRVRKNRGVGRCELCGISWPAALKLVGGRLLCYGYRRYGDCGATELHHLGGLHRGATQLLTANQHRAETMKAERMLPARFRSPQRTAIEEMISLLCGATWAADHLVDQPGSPYQAVHAPRSAGLVTVRASDAFWLEQVHKPTGTRLQLGIINVSMDDDR